jgi:hypothetical protein
VSPLTPHNFLLLPFLFLISSICLLSISICISYNYVIALLFCWWYIGEIFLSYICPSSQIIPSIFPPTKEQRAIRSHSSAFHRHPHYQHFLRRQNPPPPNLMATQSCPIFNSIWRQHKYNQQNTAVVNGASRGIGLQFVSSLLDYCICAIACNCRST